MSIGTLIVRTFRNSVGAPAQNVRIRVSSRESGEVLSDSSTDAEGKLLPLILPAPSDESTQNPPPFVPVNNEIMQETVSPPLPFGSYDITAQDGNDITTIEGVQIYENTTALQNIFFPGQSNNIDIPNPAIMGDFPEKIPESETKRLPDAGGTVVLPRPVVPALITVHAGVPSDSSAPDYTIPFKDYIKNVACSEIYATWPREAIKANVLAILSFTMNRVYTEWYRGKGYDFTITNSTAFDQAFTYGRNIFSEVSDVVDEVFTLYITRPNMVQPLFTQYCDGVRVKRNGWLSQWGSKELADNGYTASRILKFYYGRDIIIREAEQVEGIPISFPGVLSVGARGSNVRTIQNQLNVISGKFPLIPKLAVDGIYGPKTAQSVKTFQQIFNLPATGTVNFPTWYRISDVYVAVAELS